MREELIGRLERFQPWNEQEARDRDAILDLLRTDPRVFERAELTAHMTSSAWILDRAHERVLMAYHDIYRSWAWLGGHADGDEDLLRVALKEAREESGIMTVRPLSEEPLSVEVLPVEGHEKRGRYVSSHLHLNVTWLLEADDRETVRSREGENSAVAWFLPEEAVAASS